MEEYVQACCNWKVSSISCFQVEWTEVYWRWALWCGFSNFPFFEITTISSEVRFSVLLFSLLSFLSEISIMWSQQVSKIWFIWFLQLLRPPSSFYALNQTNLELCKSVCPWVKLWDGDSTYFYISCCFILNLRWMDFHRRLRLSCRLIRDDINSFMFYFSPATDTAPPENKDANGQKSTLLDWGTISA